MEKRFYREFEDIEIPDFLSPEDGWQDTSWGNDATASSEREEKTASGYTIRVWVEHDNPLRREDGQVSKFTVEVVEYGEFGSHPLKFWEAETAQECVDAIEKASKI